MFETTLDILIGDTDHECKSAKERLGDAGFKLVYSGEEEGDVETRVLIPDKLVLPETVLVLGYEGDFERSRYEGMRERYRDSHISLYRAPLASFTDRRRILSTLDGTVDGLDVPAGLKVHGLVALRLKAEGGQVVFPSDLLLACYGMGGMATTPQFFVCDRGGELYMVKPALQQAVEAAKDSLEYHRKSPPSTADTRDWVAYFADRRGPFLERFESLV